MCRPSACSFFCVSVDIHCFCLVITIPPSFISLSIKMKTLQKVIPQRQNRPSSPSPKGNILPELFNLLISIAVYYIFPCRVIKVRMSWVHALKLDSLIPMIQDTTSVKQVMECKRLILLASF